MVPGHQQYICGGFSWFKDVCFFHSFLPLCLANNLGLGLALSRVDKKQVSAQEGGGNN